MSVSPGCKKVILEDVNFDIILFIYLFIYFTPAERSFPITGDLHTIIKNMHARFEALTEPSIKMAVFTFLNFCQTTRRNNPEDRHLQNMLTKKGNKIGFTYFSKKHM